MKPEILDVRFLSATARARGTPQRRFVRRPGPTGLACADDRSMPVGRNDTVPLAVCECADPVPERGCRG